MDSTEKQTLREEIMECKNTNQLIQKLCILASNEKSTDVVDILQIALKKAQQKSDKKSEVILLGLKIAQLFDKIADISLVKEMVQKMQRLSTEINYQNGLAFSYTFVWYIERLNGNIKESREAINKASKLSNESIEKDDYIHHICLYTLAFDKWIEDHDILAAELFEICYDYFYQNGYYRSLSQTIGILSIIYTRTHSSNKILESCENLLSKQSLFKALPLDVKGISYYFTGLGHMLNMNLHFAEYFFKEAYTILNPIYENSIYFSNYVVMLSFLSTVTALQGKLEQSNKMIKELENLLKQEFFVKNLDISTKTQIHHTLNLNKFYVYSRLKYFDSEEMQDLIKGIFTGSKTLYSNFLLMSEYLLNSNLEQVKLEELLATNNFSINRVKHIISFVLIKKKEDVIEQQFLERIEIVSDRERTTKTTFIENAFSDLLIAQQLYSLK